MSELSVEQQQEEERIARVTAMLGGIKVQEPEPATSRTGASPAAEPTEDDQRTALFMRQFGRRNPA